MPSGNTDVRSDLAALTASELVDLYRRREASPAEATRAALARIESFNSRYNAFCLIDAERALRDALASQARWGAGKPLSDIDGVPTTIKDIILTKGWPTLRGSRTIDPAQDWNEDAPAVARLREAGAVLLGKTTTPEFGWKAVCDLPLTGITRNPWDERKTPGGSSGGAAVGRGAGNGRSPSRDRRRRLDPHSGCVFRRVRDQAHIWPGAGLSAQPVRHHCASRPHHRIGGGCRAHADGPRPPGRP